MWTARTWEITENSIGYQGSYVALGACYMTILLEQCSFDADCGDGSLQDAEGTGAICDNNF